jgi:hypothetical protein
MLFCTMKPSHCILEIAAGTCAAALLCTAMGASAQSEIAVEPDKPVVPARSTPSRRAYPLVNASEAQRRLAQSQLKRKQGKAPLAGERTQGQAGDTVNYQYWRRQERLRIEVEQAQRRANAVPLPLLAGASKM